MKQRRRIYYSETQKALMWERWKKGESLQKIAQLFLTHADQHAPDAHATSDLSVYGVGFLVHGFFGDCAGGT